MGLDPVQNYYCCNKHIELSTEIPEGIDEYLEKLILSIWEKKALEKGYDPVLIKIYGEKLSEAIKKGYGKDYPELDFKSPDYGMLRSLEENVWQFSTAKTYTQLRELTDALKRPDGTLRTFEEFRIQTTLITGKHLRHLKTEYNTAIIGAQMAKKWQTIQAQKHLYPLLEFIAIEDEHTTPLCRSLNGVIKHVDDPFWLRYYPPNHYLCRSTVKQRKDGEITLDENIAYPNIPEIFKVNLGQRGLAFPEDHAYFEGMPSDIMIKSREFFPYNMQFDILDESENLKGLIRQHFLVDTSAKDYLRILDLSISKTREEKNLIDILPTLDPSRYPVQRSIIFPDAKEGKSPDFRENKVLWEEEGIKTFSRRAIKGAVEAGAEQANHVIVSIPKEMKLTFELKDIAMLKFKDYPNLKVIGFKHGDLTYEYERKSKSR